MYTKLVAYLVLKSAERCLGIDVVAVRFGWLDLEDCHDWSAAALRRGVAPPKKTGGSGTHCPYRPTIGLIACPE